MESVDCYAGEEAERVEWEDAGVAKEVAKAATEGYALADEVGIFLEIGVVPVMAEVAGHEFEVPDAASLTLPMSSSRIEWQSRSGHSQILNCKSAKCLPL